MSDEYPHIQSAVEVIVVVVVVVVAAAAAVVVVVGKKGKKSTKLILQFTPKYSQVPPAPNIFYSVHGSRIKGRGNKFARVNELVSWSP